MGKVTIEQNLTSRIKSSVQIHGKMTALLVFCKVCHKCIFLLLKKSIMENFIFCVVMVAFCNLYSQQYYHFLLRLIRLTSRKALVKWISKFNISNFAINGQFYLNVSEVKNLCLDFWVMLKSVFELSYFTRKISVKKFFFFLKLQISKKFVIL